MSQTTELLDLAPFLDGSSDEVFDELREHDPLHWNEQPGGKGFWSLTRYEDIRTVGG